MEEKNLIDKFLAFLKEEKELKENTVCGYGNDVSKYISENPDWLDYDALAVKEYLSDLLSSGKAASGVSRMTASLRALYKYSYENSLVKEDISSELKYITTQRKTPEILSESEINRMFMQIEEDGFKGVRDRAILELMYATGFRATEIISLKRSDVNLKKNSVTCKGSKKRSIPLYAEASDAIRAYMITYASFLKAGKYLFVNTKGEPMTRQGLWKIISGYAKKAGIKKKISPAILRNSFAAHLLTNGADLKSVQEMMGHINITTTKIYEKLEKTRISRVYKSAHPRARG